MSTTMFKIDLQNVPLRNDHILSKASAAQIVRIMTESVKKTEEEETEFQKIFYPALREYAEKISNEFQKLCVYTSETDRNVRSANLFTQLYKTAEAGPKYHQKTHLTSNTNFGPLLEALEQRVKHVLEKDIPKRYTENNLEGEMFEKLREELKLFDDILKTVSAEYAVSRDKARSVVDMGEVAKRREEKKKERREKYEAKKNENFSNDTQKYKHKTNKKNMKSTKSVSSL